MISELRNILQVSRINCSADYEDVVAVSAFAAWLGRHVVSRESLDPLASSHHQTKQIGARILQDKGSGTL